jgi:hypothetical protein
MHIHIEQIKIQITTEISLNIFMNILMEKIELNK